MIDATRLYNEQLTEWNDFRERVLQLDCVELKKFDFGDFTIFTQFNPAREVSSNAKLDAKSIANRKCFLCEENHPVVQRGLPINKNFTVFVNPFPILKGHLTIINNLHQPQAILPVISEFILFTKELPNFTLLYNGPASGASAPDHLHFQAVFKGQLPFETEKDKVGKRILSESKANGRTVLANGKMELWTNYGRTTIHIESESAELAKSYFEQVYKQYQMLNNNEEEPKMNLFGLYENGIYHLFVFPRKRHRPECFFAEGEAFRMVSPGAIDMAGILVLPRRKDFDEIDKNEIKSIYKEVTL